MKTGPFNRDRCSSCKSCDGCNCPGDLPFDFGSDEDVAKVRAAIERCTDGNASEGGTR